MTRKQRDFCEADADEVLFGGAAGGGKSYGQLIDALLFALRYSGSRQLILRRTYPELERSIISAHLALYPREIYAYLSSLHKGRFANGSVIEFGSCDSESDVYKYQSAEYDIIRFDELTHFTEGMYTYLISRVRGANGFPKSVKSTTNPGGIGHRWVKERFIDSGPQGVKNSFAGGSRIFIQSLVDDNVFLMKHDPMYKRRLENLDEKNRKALLLGQWDIFEGQYFCEFDRSLHVVRPFAIPRGWARYFAMDYGLDMLAGYWIALDPFGRAYVYREVYRQGLVISRAAELIKEMTREEITAYIAPPDLWNRRQDSGRSAADIFSEHGIPLVKASNDRVQGWYDLKEWLRAIPDEHGVKRPCIVFFDDCVNIIRCLPSVVHDKNNPNDVSREPHELTHAPDALRYFCAGRPVPAQPAEEECGERPSEERQIDDFLEYGR